MSHFYKGLFFVSWCVNSCLSTTEKPIAIQDDVFRVSFAADYFCVITTNYLKCLFINLPLYSSRDDLCVLFPVSTK